MYLHNRDCLGEILFNGVGDGVEVLIGDRVFEATTYSCSDGSGEREYHVQSRKILVPKKDA
jgi:hypothetical protein